MSSQATFPSGSAAAAGLLNCQNCFSVQPASHRHCVLCRRRIHLRKPYSVQKTLALLVTAIVLYIPANVLPIMLTTQFGTVTRSTVIQGVWLLWQHGSYLTALVIFVASVVVPIAKMLALGWLCWTVLRKSRVNHTQREALYRVTEYIGRWSMVDVFVVALLVALVQVAGILSIAPGPAALAFCGVVVFTMLAADAFDSRLIWDHQ